MNILIEEPIKFSKYNKLLNDIKRNSNEGLSILGLTDSQKAHMVYSLFNYSRKCPVIVCSNVTTAKKMIQDLKFYSETEIVYFPPREVIYYDSDTESREIENARVYAINKVLEGSECIIVTVVEALMQKMLPKSTYMGKDIVFKVGAEIDLESIVKTLSELGYSKHEIVDGKGKFAVRGGIIDVFPINSDKPYRIELFGDEIDSIRTFDVDTQKSQENVKSLEITFSNEYIITEDKKVNVIERLNEIAEETILTELKKRILNDIEEIEENRINKNIYKYFDLFLDEDITFLDYLDGRVIYFDEMARIKDRAAAILLENNESLKILTEKEEILPKYAFKYENFEKLEIKHSNLLTVYLDRINKDRNLHAKRKEYSFSCREVNFFRSSMDVQIGEIKRYLNGENLVILVFSTLKKVETIKNALIDNGVKVKEVYSLNEIDGENRSSAYILNGIVSSGFVYEDMNIALFAEDISGTNLKSKKASKDFLGEMLNSYNDLTVGDFVVHQSYGIGKYLGVETVETYGVVKDYIKIEYRDGGMLYVPVTSLEYIKKYVCDEGFEPKINKLGTKDWDKTKRKVGKHIKDIAKDLIKLYAKREQAVGFAFPTDTPWQNEFESDFEYELTDDQKRCIEEMKNDMESSKPMDRLLCGDVGYGKTEVAIRGAFKAVMGGKQVAYLVPTTVLCLQQYNVFKHRMEDYGIRVEMLSRFKTQKEQKEVLQKLELGDIDVVVGTHRLLSKDVKFKDLGFLIIDEEHRFGVEHKEAIKKYKTGVDVLSMTATPIPRTLHMSMIGIRDVSVIMEPPLERMPVHTYVMGYDSQVIKQAIEKELDRDGQVFYLNNRVENIDEITNKVKELVPYAKVECAHGQMPPKQVEDIMIRFMDKEVNVLVCTTILESGIDIPNANTIVVENADKLGLAQLYQIRGRVGRSNKMAYAYVTYDKRKTISEDAEKRLVAIKDYTEFGSGLKIALRDLEIRGAGNLLGAEQHGHIADIGYEMYSAMLERAINEEKALLNNEKLPESSDYDYLKNDVKLSIDISANIPDTYISSSAIKIEMYQKLSNATDEEKLRDVTLELIDRFGNMPKEVENLISIIEIRNMCKILNITELKCKCEHFVILPYDLKFRLTKGEKRDILLTIKATLKNLIESRNLKYSKGEDLK